MSKILVSYFSATGETRFKANELARLLQADIEEIEPISKYTNDDLDWRNIHSRSSEEMNDQNSRPNIIEPKLNPSNYDILFIGFPIWWYVEPRIIDTYLDKFDLKGIKIIPFATSGGSSISNSVKHLKTLYSNLNISDGILLNDEIDIDRINKIIK